MHTWHGFAAKRSPERRTHDWCLTAESVKPCDIIPTYFLSVTNIMETAQIHGNGDLLGAYTLGDVALRKLHQYVDIVSLKHITIFQLHGSPFMLEAASVSTSFKNGNRLSTCELSMGLPEWYETKNESRSVLRTLMDANKLFEIVCGVDSVLQRLEI
jgi:hypothetical protein